MYQGKIVYNVNLSTKFVPLTKLHSETYEEAVKIVMEEKLSTLSCSQKTCYAAKLSWIFLRSLHKIGVNS